MQIYSEKNSSKSRAFCFPPTRINSGEALGEEYIKVDRIGGPAAILDFDMLWPIASSRFIANWKFSLIFRNVIKVISDRNFVSSGLRPQLKEISFTDVVRSHQIQISFHYKIAKFFCLFVCCVESTLTVSFLFVAATALTHFSARHRINHRVSERAI